MLKNVNNNEINRLGIFFSHFFFSFFKLGSIIKLILTENLLL